MGTRNARSGRHLVPALLHPTKLSLPQDWAGFQPPIFNDNLTQPFKVAMSASRLFKLIDGGWGSGVGEQYCPWIRVRRLLTSKVSHVHAAHCPLYRHRQLQLLSDEEDYAMRLATWLGAIEVREQFPLWPDAHENPRGGWHPERDRSLRDAPGLLEIAKEAGIDHGRFAGTSIPYVATTDLLLRVGIPPDDKLVLWQCKPKGELKVTRVRERIELEVRYARAIGALHRVIHKDVVPLRVHANLKWLQPLRSEVDGFGCSTQLRDFASEFMERSKSDPIHQCRREAAAAVRIPAQMGDNFFRMAAWGGLIDIDLAQPVLMTRQLRRDPNQLHTSLRRRLIGIRS